MPDHAVAPDLKPVAVTRWSARLVDPQCEHDYRLQRFPDERRRALLLAGLITAAGVLSLIFEIYAVLHGLSRIDALVPPLVSSALPIAGLLVFVRVRSPYLLETLMVGGAVVGITTRMVVLTLHPHLINMWPALMVATLFVFYLYLPIRFTASVALATAFSFVAPVWWAMVQDPILPAGEIYRGIVWLALANALGFIAANTLQRSQRTQFAQRLLLERLLSTDAMTGIANRRRFDEALAREWRRCGRAKAPLSLLMIDVDHFKAYNDHCGHLQGDDCLRQLALLLQREIGRPGDLVARYGGEEFVCLLPEIGAAGALAVADKLSAAVRDANIVHPRSPAGPRLTISVGAATAADLTGNPRDLVAAADKLLYAAKASGRNQVKVGRLNAGGARRAA